MTINQQPKIVGMQLAQAGRQAVSPLLSFPGRYSLTGHSDWLFSKRSYFFCVWDEKIGAKNPSGTSDQHFSEQKMRVGRKTFILRSKNCRFYVKLRQNGTKTRGRTSNLDKMARKMAVGRPTSILRSENSWFYVKPRQNGTENDGRTSNFDFSLHFDRNYRNSSNLWQKYATAKVGAMVIRVSNTAGMHRWRRLLAT